MFGCFVIILIHDRDQNRAADTESITCTTTLLAHLDFRPCELLPSLFFRRPSVNISHFNLLLRNCNQTLEEWSFSDLLPQLCPVIPTSNQDGHEAKNRNKGDEILKHLLWNYWANLNQILMKWSLGGPLCATKKNKYSNSCVVRKEISERNKKHTPTPHLQVKWSVPKISTYRRMFK